MKVEDIPIGYYTHVVFFFSLVNPKTFRLTPMDPKTGELYSSVADIKSRYPEIRV